MKSTKANNNFEFRSAIKETKTIAKIIESGLTCLMCFVSEPRIIEGHHVGGKKNSSFIISLCANCHVLATKNQLNYPQNWSDSGVNNLKMLYVLRDLQFLEQKITQFLVDKLGEN